VVLTDYTMPGMSGADLLEIVAARWPTVGRVIVSGRSDLDDLQAARHAGIVEALLPKPWDRDGVLQIVATVSRAHGS
jgi:YesN/AraC family two-component response regulator